MFVFVSIYQIHPNRICYGCYSNAFFIISLFFDWCIIVFILLSYVSECDMYIQSVTFEVAYGLVTEFFTDREKFWATLIWRMSMKTM